MKHKPNQLDVHVVRKGKKVTKLVPIPNADGLPRYVKFGSWFKPDKCSCGAVYDQK